MKSKAPEGLRERVTNVSLFPGRRRNLEVRIEDREFKASASILWRQDPKTNISGNHTNRSWRSKDTMKRHRIFPFDLDFRADSLEPVPEQWEEKVRELHIEAQRKTIEGLRAQYGEWNIESKIQNFIDLKSKPFSVAAFHNKFLEQIRNAYVVGSYYPALTGACALGERILNHLMIKLREYHKDTPEYRRVYRKCSFDNWSLPIDALESWDELLPEAASRFHDLNVKRNSAIHFDPETDHNDKELSIEAIHLIQEIVSIQFAAIGNQPWYFYVPGETYIKKEWEDRPFIKYVLIPNSLLVGPNHEVESVIPQIVVNDQFDYQDKDITDEEFTTLRQNRNQSR